MSEDVEAGSGNFSRAVGIFQAGDETQGVETVVIVAGAVLGFSADEESVGGRIDNGSGSDADFRDEVAGFAGVGIGDGGFPGLEHGSFPELLAGGGIGIESVDEVAFCGDKDDVVFIAIGHGEAGDVERLCVDIAWNGAILVDGAGEESTKGGRRKGRGRESIFFEILAGTLRIVVMGEDAWEIGDGDGDGSGNVGIGNTGGGDGMGARSSGRRGSEETGRRDRAGRGATAADGIDGPGNTEILRIVGDGGSELQRLRQRDRSSLRTQGHGDRRRRACDGDQGGRRFGSVSNRDSLQCHGRRIWDSSRSRVSDGSISDVSECPASSGGAARSGERPGDAFTKRVVQQRRREWQRLADQDRCRCGRDGNGDGL